MKQILFLLTLINGMNVSMAQDLAGTWRAALETPGGDLPFQLEIYQLGVTWVASIINGEEQLTSSDVVTKGDQVIFRSDVFHTEIIAQLSHEKDRLTGFWQDHSRGDDYRIPFYADKDRYHRFSESPEQAAADISGDWKCTFVTSSGDTTMAIGRFRQDGNHLEGTFLTNSGDYRYLEGEVNGSSFSLSAFDGSHAFLFTGVIGELACTGTFNSGNHWEERFEMVRDPDFVLGDPDRMTYQSGTEALAFCFPDQEGNSICLTDDRFRDKAVIVQIMGSWCPNCMDESRFLAEVYREYRDNGLEIIAVGFERETDLDAVSSNFDRIRQKLGIGYTMLLGGGAGKKHASAAFPELNRVIAYPTTILLDRNHRVVWIHTGYNGPATGQDHEVFREHFFRHLQEVL